MSTLQEVSIHYSIHRSTLTLKLNLQHQTHHHLHLTDRSYARGLHSVPKVADLIKLHARSCPPWLGLHPGTDDISGRPHRCTPRQPV